jgi:hypothetical protein
VGFEEFRLVEGLSTRTIILMSHCLWVYHEEEEPTRTKCTPDGLRSQNFDRKLRSREYSLLISLKSSPSQLTECKLISLNVFVYSPVLTQSSR